MSGKYEGEVITSKDNINGENGNNKLQSTSKSNNQPSNNKHKNKEGTKKIDDKEVHNYYADKIRETAQQHFPTLEITQESVDMLNGFLLDSLAWIVMESGKLCSAENADWISSRHVCCSHLYNKLNTVGTYPKY